MKKNINELIKNICEKQNYDEMLIGLINIGKDSEINNILEELDADNSIDDKKKREIYEKIFEFVSNINEELKENVKKIFEMGVKETIKELRNNEDRIKKIDKVCEAINAYIKIRPKLDKSNKDYNALFLSSRGKRISKRSVQNIIKSELVELVEAEGKESKKYHTHTLRHTGATLLYNEANANIFVLKIILGHESLDATQVYTHVSDKKLKELMQNFNILDRKE